MPPADPEPVPVDAVGHPGPASVRLPGAIVEAIVAHARSEAPQEACGLVIGTAEPDEGGVALRYEPCRNEAASPVRFRVHPDDVVRLLVAADEAGEALWAIVHSHVRTPAAPSATDVEAAAWWPSTLHVLVSLDPGLAGADTGRPSLRAWRIVGGVTFEVAVEPA